MSYPPAFPGLVRLVTLFSSANKTGLTMPKREDFPAVGILCLLRGIEEKAFAGGGEDNEGSI